MEVVHVEELALAQIVRGRPLAAEAVVKRPLFDAPKSKRVSAELGQQCAPSLVQ